MRKNTNGFTIIELVVVIVIIGILATISIVGFTSIQQGARDTQRSSKITAVSEALEKYFSSNGEYPSCAAMTATPASTVTTNTLKGLDPDTLTTPSAAKGTNSITSCVANPTSDTFSYFGGITNYTLKYKEDSSGNVIPLDGRHQVVTPTYTLTITAGTGGTVNTAVNGTYTSGSTPTITATPNTYHYATWSGSAGCVTGADSHTILMDGNKTCSATFPLITIPPVQPPVVSGNTVGSSTTFSWPASSCGSNTARYNYVYTISPSGYNSGSVATAATSVTFTTSTEGQTYKVLAQAECYNAATGGGMSAFGATGAGNPYYRPIPIPCTVSGGSVTTSGGYTINTFTSSGTLQLGPSCGTISGASVLIVAGGRNGIDTYGFSGIGGAGGKVTILGSQSLTGTITVTVGGINASSIFGGTTSSGSGAAGGTRAAVKVTGNPGAAGTLSGISGSSVYYGGGGGAGGWDNDTPYDVDHRVDGGAGGAGGGGGGGDGLWDNAGWGWGGSGGGGSVNTGGGGGGGGQGYDDGGASGSGGSGIVIVRYLTP